MSSSFGSRRIYYNNFAEHLLNVYNPNMTYPGLPYCWSDADWRGTIDMIADFGFNVFEFWLVPRLFCRAGLEDAFGAEFTRQIHRIAEYAHARGLKVEALIGLATVGDRWHTLCPNCPAEWAELQYLWDQWTKRLHCLDVVGIFPGDPGACSRHGCTALTFIDRACDIAHLVQRNLPACEIDLGTWGPPFFGWGNIEGPENWQGEFVQAYQHTAWRSDPERTRQAMNHLLQRLPDFPAGTRVSINLGFNPDGRPEGDEDARPWARAIAELVPIDTWDFSLTEGENAILPHYRFERLFAQRRREREAAPYSGGICYTMSPRLNLLSLYEAARSFIEPDADYDEVAREFYRRAFGPGAEELVEDLILFEIVKEWGNYVELELSRAEFHRRAERLYRRTAAWRGRLNGTLRLYPSAEFHRAELEWYSRWFRDLSAPNPDYAALRREYWERVYAIYDQLPAHVDPRPAAATDRIIDLFRHWRPDAAAERPELSAGEWVKRAH